MDARSDRERRAAGRLHALLLERGLMPAAAYLSGARQLLDVAVDLATDVPAVWLNLSQLLAPVLLSTAAGVTLSALATAAQGCVQEGGGVRLTLALLKQLREANRERMVELVPAGFHWQRLLGEQEPRKLLKEVGALPALQRCNVTCVRECWKIVSGIACVPSLEIPYQCCIEIHLKTSWGRIKGGGGCVTFGSGSYS